VRFLDHQPLVSAQAAFCVGPIEAPLNGQLVDGKMALVILALANAERRARNSYFDQHIVADDEAGYIAIDEGDYGALPVAITDRIVHSIPGGLLDEF
jgi:hypothetical protein